jgi:hypothetical protein
MAPARSFPDTVACSDFQASYGLLTLAPEVEGIVCFTVDIASGVAAKVLTVGEPCGRASDAAACKAGIEASVGKGSKEAIGWDENRPTLQGQVVRVGFAVRTLGDRIIEVRSLGQLQVLIAPIESLQEAQGWAQLDHKGASCTDPPRPNARLNADGYDLYADVSQCFCGTRWHQERIVRVSREGFFTYDFQNNYGTSNDCPPPAIREVCGE